MNTLPPPITDAGVISPAMPPSQWRDWLHRQRHYGWLTILIGAVAMAATYPGRTHGLGMVTEPMLKDLNLADPAGRVFYAKLNMWGTLLGALFCVPVGWLFDRVNHRLLLALNLIALGIAVVCMSRVESWESLLLFLVLTRGLGQSALSVVSINIVAKGFPPQRLGMAMAFYSILSAPCHLILIKSAGYALTHGTPWRSVWLWVGISLAGLSLLAALLARSVNVVVQANTPDQPTTGATLGQALRTPAFWVFSLTISMWGMIYSGVALFNEDIFHERGFSKEVYFDVLAFVTIVALVSKLFFGWLCRYVRLSVLLGMCLLTTALALFGLPQATQVWHVYLYGVCLGIASGAVALLFFVVWGQLYGHRALGRIQGIAQMLTVFASACGPLLFSSGKKWTTSYTAVFEWLACGMLLLAIAAFVTPLPKFVTEEQR